MINTITIHIYICMIYDNFIFLVISKFDGPGNHMLPLEFGEAVLIYEETENSGISHLKNYITLILILVVGKNKFNSSATTLAMTIHFLFTLKYIFYAHFHTITFNLSGYGNRIELDFRLDLLL